MLTLVGIVSVVSKVDKGVVLGVAQTLGTEYFPAACGKGASFLDPVAGAKTFSSALGVKVCWRSQSETAGELAL